MKRVLFAVIGLLALSAGAQTADDGDLKRLQATNGCFGCDLSAAELREASLSGADLREANLFGADLSGANLSGTELRVPDLQLTSELTQQQVSSACSDPERPPRLPSGLEPPPSCAD